MAATKRWVCYLSFSEKSSRFVQNRACIDNKVDIQALVWHTPLRKNSYLWYRRRKSKGLNQVEKLISVVIPSKNEERTIAQCIESILEAVRSIDAWEIVLVDSCSTDNTVKIAKKYPISILRLRKEWFISPHAGQYIGTINSSGKYVFYLDADMAVDKNWITTALEILEKDNGIAGITGVIYNVLPDEKRNNNHPISRHKIGYVNHLPGPAIFRRRTLIDVNHFNPYLKGYGERELGYRLSSKGFKLLRVENTISHHFKKDKNLSEIVEKASYFIGVGQFLKLHFNLQTILETLMTYKRIVIFNLAVFIYFLILVLCVVSGLSKIILILLIAAFLVPMYHFFKHRNLKTSYLYFNSIFLTSLNFFYGFFKNTKQPETYPVNVEIIK